MPNPPDAATRLQAATQTVKVLSRLCLRHPDLRPALRQATASLRSALVELQGALLPATVTRAPQRPVLALRDPTRSQEEGVLAKALLLEVILRAASDWVLYKEHIRPMYREWANDAYTWIFQEGPEHPNWRERRASGKLLTSFVSICEALDFDPDLVRRHIQKLTPQRIISMGRPAEYRRKRVLAPEYADTSDVRSFFSSEGGLM
jgi:hypothetical protein